MKRFLKIATGVCCMMAIACKKEMIPYTPGNGQTAAVNFYALSQTFLSLAGDVGIFTDTTHAQGNFQLNGKSASGVYPFLVTDKNAIIYLDYTAGNHLIAFKYLQPDSASSITLTDSTISLAANSHNMLYMTDGPAAEGAPATYSIVPVQEPWDQMATNDKVNVRLVHLSEDAGTAKAVLLNAAGTEIPAGLPQSLNFKNYSDYIQLDTTANAQYGQLLLHIYTPASAQPVLVGVPAQPGRSFEVLLTGLAHQHSRQVITGKNTDGSLQYKQVSLPANLGTIVRTTY